MYKSSQYTFGYTNYNIFVWNGEKEYVNHCVITFRNYFNCKMCLIFFNKTFLSLCLVTTGCYVQFSTHIICIEYKLANIFIQYVHIDLLSHHVLWREIFKCGNLRTNKKKHRLPFHRFIFVLLNLHLFNYDNFF